MTDDALRAALEAAIEAHDEATPLFVKTLLGNPAAMEDALEAFRKALDERGLHVISQRELCGIVDGAKKAATAEARREYTADDFDADLSGWLAELDGAKFNAPDKVATCKRCHRSVVVDTFHECTDGWLSCVYSDGNQPGLAVETTSLSETLEIFNPKPKTIKERIPITQPTDAWIKPPKQKAPDEAELREQRDVESGKAIGDAIKRGGG